MLTRFDHWQSLPDTVYDPFLDPIIKDLEERGLKKWHQSWERTTQEDRPIEHTVTVYFRVTNVNYDVDLDPEIKSLISPDGENKVKFTVTWSGFEADELHDKFVRKMRDLKSRLKIIG
jgi:hypothetical protein